MLITSNDLGLAFMLAILAWIFVNILQDEEMIFSWWQDVLDRLPKWLSKPLGGCDRCMAGSMAFWLFFLQGDYNIVRHLCFTALTIFLVGFIDWLHCKFSN